MHLPVLAFPLKLEKNWIMLNAVQTPESRTWESAGSESSVVKNKQFMEIAVETVRIPKIAGKLSDHQRLPDRTQSKTTTSIPTGREDGCPCLGLFSAPFVIFISEIKFVEERNASSSLVLGFDIQVFKRHVYSEWTETFCFLKEYKTKTYNLFCKNLESIFYLFRESSSPNQNDYIVF